MKHQNPVLEVEAVRVVFIAWRLDYSSKNILRCYCSQPNVSQHELSACNKRSYVFSPLRWALPPDSNDWGQSPMAGGLLWAQKRTSEFHKKQDLRVQTKQLSVSEGFCSM
jgi:hypothetical protein